MYYGKRTLKKESKIVIALTIVTCIMICGATFDNGLITNNIAVASAQTVKSNLTVLSTGTISSSFGMRWGKMHKGIDIAANKGTPIYAAMDGTVIYSGWIEGYGYIVKLQHEDSIVSMYAHCSKLLVEKGDKVEQGDLIAKVGSTGRSTGPHLHFEVRVNGVAVEPSKYLYKQY